MYDSTVCRLQEFIESISPQTEAFEEEVVQTRLELKETPAERLLREKSREMDGFDIATNRLDITHELAVYNKLPKPPVKSTIFRFWCENESLLPLLSKAVRVTLSVPCSSATVERTFKVGVHQVTNHRTRLNPKMVEGVIITKANSGRVDMSGIDREQQEDDSSEYTDSDSSSDDQDDTDQTVLDAITTRWKLFLFNFILKRFFQKYYCSWKR